MHHFLAGDDRIELSISHENGRNLCFLLYCALNVLHDASLAWFRLLTSLIRPVGLCRDDREPCVEESETQVLILTYVDDLLMVSETAAAETAVREAVGSQFGPEEGGGGHAIAS